MVDSHRVQCTHCFISFLWRLLLKTNKIYLCMTCLIDFMEDQKLPWYSQRCYVIFFFFLEESFHILLISNKSMQKLTILLLMIQRQTMICALCLLYIDKILINIHWTRSRAYCTCEYCVNLPSLCPTTSCFPLGLQQTRKKNCNLFQLKGSRMYLQSMYKFIKYLYHLKERI